jgi:hypothetical protein
MVKPKTAVTRAWLFFVTDNSTHRTITNTHNIISMLRRILLLVTAALVISLGGSAIPAYAYHGQTPGWPPQPTYHVPPSPITPPYIIGDEDNFRGTILYNTGNSLVVRSGGTTIRVFITPQTRILARYGTQTISTSLYSLVPGQEVRVRGTWSGTTQSAVIADRIVVLQPTTPPWSPYGYGGYGYPWNPYGGYGYPRPW